MTTIFGKIIAGEMPAQKVFENERILAIKDLFPKAPVHLLIMPKKEIPNLQSVSKEDLPLISEIVEIAQNLADTFNVAEGYRLIVNNGAEAGQSVSHLHFHLIGGKTLGGMA
ncbi:HIT-like protein CPn_0488/CP_0266/CPj0488/CpB0508 [Waddlia chondrophila 2032/99]|nr:histidine triad nucleotide-binding protein [Waddlia chondrophila]CCB91318.1 HIT-like protein CPn_0488/CP_0266/CPj0488/CpB0508 [Waddlia chondrophila 2032/99]